MLGFMKKKKEETISYGVIGLGKFGYTLAIQLAEYGYDFLVVDKDENLVQDLRTVTESAIVVDDYDKKSIKDSGVKNYDVVIVCLEEQLEKSLLVTLNLINLGIKKVISVADTSEHGEILEKIGAEVVYPKRDMAIRLASRLRANMVLDFVQLNEEINIYKASLPKPLVGQTVVGSGLRTKFELNIIAIQNAAGVTDMISPNYIFQEGDLLFLAGSRDGFKALTEWVGLAGE